MSINVRFLGPLKQYQPSANDAGMWVVDAEGKTITYVLAQSSLMENEMDFMQLVNGKSVNREYILAEGDKVDIMLTLLGG